MKPLARRLEKIEKRLEPNSNALLRFPLPGGRFIEVPGASSLADVAALCRARINGSRRDER